MICTCTMNPSLDLVMEGSQKLTAGYKNRTMQECYEAGGKGIKVSQMLNQLQIPSKALGFLGGFVQDYFIRLLEQYTYIRPNFVYIDGLTRINIKYSYENEETDINAQGPAIKKEDMDQLAKKVEHLTDGDIFVLAGALMHEHKEETLAMLKNAQKDGVNVCLDTADMLAKEYLNENPLLIQLLAEEAARFYDNNVSLENNKKNVFRLKEDGAQNAIVIHEEEKLAWLANEEGVFECSLKPSVPVLKTVGMSSALLAGFLMNYQRSGNSLESFKYGCAFSRAVLQQVQDDIKEQLETSVKTIDVRKVA